MCTESVAACCERRFASDRIGLTIRCFCEILLLAFFQFERALRVAENFQDEGLCDH